MTAAPWSALAPPDAALVAFAAEVGAEGPVAVEGHRTRWDLGGALEAGTRVLRAPAGIVEHQPAEMTVRVRAGTPVVELHAALAEAGQRTALPQRGGTVGGALAVGESHLCALGRGPVRDAVLQVSYVSADGRLVTGGGPTVKNVSGYDLPRLLVGSLGTLGLLAEVVLRTQAIPATTVWLRSRSVDPFAVRAALYRPAAVLWDGRSTWVSLEGHPDDVTAETGVLERAGSWTAVDGPPALPPQRWSVAPGELRHLAPGAPGSWVASVGVGIVHASAPAPPRRTPAPLAALGRRVKESFDPSGRLAPGRDPARR
ncbi:MAG: FAD-binding protein [Acidimicrobiales bacterium]